MAKLTWLQHLTLDGTALSTFAPLASLPSDLRVLELSAFAEGPDQLTVQLARFTQLEELGLYYEIGEGLHHSAVLLASKLSSHSRSLHLQSQADGSN